MKTKYDYIIGIDTGVKTGVAIFDVQKNCFNTIDTVAIHNALDCVHKLRQNKILVRVEDARLRKWIPKNQGREKLQGVGSVKRDAKIWEDFLKDHKIEYDMVAPKYNTTKLNAFAFEQITGITQRTSEHARDAAGLCFKFIRK